MYSELIQLGALTIAANKELRSEAATLRTHANAIRANATRCRARRFRPMSGASDVRDDDRVRRLLRDFCAVIQPPKSYAGLSRGSICQACGNIIKAGDLEYDIVAATSEIRLDVDCHRIFIEESRAARRAGSPDARSA